MTESHEAELEAVDRAARAASQGLHAHVARRLDPELLLTALPAVEPPRRRGRLLGVAAALALIVGSVALLGDDGAEDERTRLELDEDGNKRPAPEPGVLTPLGPNDGRDSIQLPVAVEPSSGLDDGDTVTVSSTGFVPGEQVGIVQCATEAGGETRDQRAGIDGCDLGRVEYAEADADGRATGTFTVRRVLTTPVTGTVDCAEAERCIVAMGAISDYDRSGGFGLAFAGGGEPIDIPTVTVTPAEGLADGDVVHVEGEGFAPDALLGLSVCSVDPSGCWNTGEEHRLSGDELADLGYGDHGMDAEVLHIGLRSDGDGRVQGDVPVWRFLPGTTAGTYIDCAVSRCALRLAAATIGDVDPAGSSPVVVPAPVPLAFTPGGSGPTPPAIAVDPTSDLVRGQTVVVRGAGFVPGTSFSVTLCVAPADQPANELGCLSQDSGDHRVDDDGGFATEFELPDPADLGEVTATTMCTPEGRCAPGDGGVAPLSCAAATMRCVIRVDSYALDGRAVLEPQFPPEPVPVTFRR